MWRDAPSVNADEANVPPPSPRPVWRDSDELLREFTGEDLCGVTKADSQRFQEEPERTPCRSSRSPSPLPALLRRKRTQHKRAGKPPSEVAPGGVTEERRAKVRVPSRRRPTAGKAVWKDSPPVPRRVLIDTTKLVDLISDVGMPPRTTSIAATATSPASRKGLEERAFGCSSVAGEVGAGSQLPPPPNEKAPRTNRHWRHITHPLRVRRKGEQGWRGRSSTRESVPRPFYFSDKSAPGRGELTRSRHSSSGFLSAAPSSSSTVSFWKSTAPAPDVSTPARTSRSRLLLSSGVFLGNSGVRTGSKKSPAPPRAPAFEPRRGSPSDHHRARSDRRSRPKLPASHDHTQPRHKSSGIRERGGRFSPPDDGSPARR